MPTRALALAVLPLLLPPVARAGEAPSEVVAWLKANARPLATVAPEGARSELEPLRAIVGSARIVGLGEATHGSHEFFAFKRRALEYLVAELGFTDFAMETDWTQALAVDAFVSDGQGDLDSAVKALSGLWRTEEYRELLAWMRAWNADPAHARKVRFHGLDMGAPGPTGQRLKAYLARVDPEVGDSVAPVIDQLAGGARVEESDLEGLLALFDEMKEPF